jgi:hypothetical protein
VKVADQLTDGRVHGVLNRGDVAEISTYIQNSIENDFSGNVIDVCPVGALTDKTFRFKSRVWYTKPVDAHRDCPHCTGKVRLWYKGDDVLRVTARKDKYGEVEDIEGKPGWICNECRFEKKDLSKWKVIGPRVVDRHSVISQGKYETKIDTPTKKIDMSLRFRNRIHLKNNATENNYTYLVPYEQSNCRYHVSVQLTPDIKIKSRIFLIILSWHIVFVFLNYL